ncbi:MAG: M23 family metallopeptidase [Cyanobacteriota bacterium]|nr:M23 family metallopeptidase [Cyanobacteriota bacterium]
MKNNTQTQLRLLDLVEFIYEVCANWGKSRKSQDAIASTDLVPKTAPSFAWYANVSALMLGIFACLAAPERVRSLLALDPGVNPLPIDLPAPFPTPSPPPPLVAKKTGELFQSPQSLGARAIGHAEGNLTVSGKPTSLYYGHDDPGNFKRNQGWCSDQGRGGGDVVVADRKCLERMQQRLPLLAYDLRAASIDPEGETEVFLNAADLYNQASPWVSRQFPQKYAAARQQGKQGEDALVWARVEAFRRNGRIDASGLIGICRREKRGVSDWDCVAGDQRRRVKAIARVLSARGNTNRDRLRTPVQGTITQGYSTVHPAIDFAGTLGSPVVAAQAGEVVFAGWNEFGLGNTIKIKHPDGKTTVYGHNQGLLVKVGQQVKQGDAIAKLGNSGNSTGPHLHFEVRDRNGDFVDPLPFLSSE